MFHLLIKSIAENAEMKRRLGRSHEIDMHHDVDAREEAFPECVSTD